MQTGLEVEQSIVVVVVAGAGTVAAGAGTVAAVVLEGPLLVWVLFIVSKG